MRNLVEEVLDWGDVDRMRALFGEGQLNPQLVETYNKLEIFYTAHRDNIHEALHSERDAW